MYVEAAKSRDEALDHVLFYGPPGLGKTTLAYIIANEMGSDIKTTSGPAISKTGDIAAILSNLKKKEILFIDEIHRLPKPVEEILYTAMEEFRIDILVGKGPTANSISLKLEEFTLIGATTKLSLLSAPLRSRFGIIEKLDLYKTEDLYEILKQAAQSILNIKFEKEALIEIARKSRGTPRTALKLLRRVRDFAQINKITTVNSKTAKEALESIGLDELGLDKTDRKILSVIIERFNGGPVGLKTIATTIDEDPNTLQEIYEPYLISLGLLEKTPRGRKATKEAYKHLGYKIDQLFDLNFKG